MARTTGPLHSTAAAGQIAGSIIYQKINGRNVAKNYAKPGDRLKKLPTASQLAVRAETKLLMQAWPLISPADQATWDTLAVPANVSRINSYLQFNFARWQAGLPTSSVYPPITGPIIALVVSTISPINLPNCMGDYIARADVNGQPAWERTDQAYFILFDPGGNEYLIIDTLEEQSCTERWYNNDSNATGLYIDEVGHSDASVDAP